MEDNENVSPEFSELKRNPFSVPENYFEQFSAQMQQQIQAQPTVSKRIVIVLRPYIAAAAMIAIIISVAFWIRQSPSLNNNVAEVDTMQYLRYYGIDENQIVNYIANEEDYETETIESTETDAVADYLLEQGTSPELMYSTVE
jgi:hypothetical protein